MADTLIREGTPRSGDPALPVPQIWDPANSAYAKQAGRKVAAAPEEWAGNQIAWGKTAGGVYVPLAVDASGNLQIGVTGSNTSQTPGSAVAGKDGQLVAATDGTNAQLLQMQAAGSPNLRVSIWDTAAKANVATPADAAANVNGLVTAARLQVWNGTTWDNADGVNTGQLVVTPKTAAGLEGLVSLASSDTVGPANNMSFTASPMYGYNSGGNYFERWRNNTESTLLASAARTASAVTVALTNYNHSRLTLTLDITAKVGATTFDIYIQTPDGNGDYVNLQATGALPSAIGTTDRVIFGIGVVDTDYVAAAVAKSIALPRSIKITVVPSDADSATYSLYGAWSL